MKQPQWNVMARFGVVAGLCVVLLAACGRDSPELLINSARDYLAKGDSNAAVIQLRNALQKSPNNAEARYLLGTVLTSRRDPAGAVKELRMALQLGYPPDQTLPALVRALIDDGDAKDVVSEFGNTNLGKADAQAAFKTTIGNAQLSLGKQKEAETAFTAALAAKSDFAGALLGIATLRATNGDIQGAKKLVEDVLAKPDAPPEASLMKARLLLAENQRDAALAVLQKAVDAKPDYLPARYELVSLLISKGELDPASAQIGAIRKVSKQDVRAYFFDALIASQRGNLPVARDAIQQVLKVSPEHVPSLLLAGEIEYRARQFNQAQDYLRRAMKISPDLPYAQRLLAATYLRLGAPTRAVEVLQGPLSRGSKDPELMAVAGEAYLAVGDFPRAAEYFAQTAALDPKNAAARTRLGQVRFAEGDTEAAIRDLEAASALDPTVSPADLALIANLLRQKQFDQALAAAGRLEKKQPNNPLVYNLKGIVFLTKRDLATARLNFERALQIQPDYLPAVSNLAQLDRLEKKPDTGRKRYEAILEKEPKNEQALLGLAGLLQSLGADPKEIESVLKRAVTANAQSVSARVALTTFYLRRGDGRQALAAAEEANAALANDPRTLELLGQVQLSTGEPMLAVATFNKLVAAKPGSVEPLVRLAGALVVAKDYDKAVDKLREALTINPEFFEASRDIVIIYAQSGRTDQALLEIKAIQRRKPGDARGYLLEGDLWLSQQKWREAEAAYRAAQKLAPDDGAAAAKLYAAMAEAGNSAQADAMADKWLKGHPKDVVLHAYLGERTLRKQDYKSATRHYQALVALQPDNAMFLNNLAWVASELGDAKALSYAEKAAALAPANPAILDTLGMLLVKKGDVTQGVEKLQKAAQIAPNVASFRLHLAKALIKAGDKQAARKELDTLAQASNATPDKAGAMDKGKTADQKSAPQPAGKVPSLTCSPECASEVATLLKTL
jgi:putative PEP-CTERM system TPR-repeat lipoprotein